MIVAQAGIGLYHLAAVAKWVVSIATVVSCERIILHNAIAAGLQSRDQLPEAADDEGKMSLRAALKSASTPKWTIKASYSHQLRHAWQDEAGWAPH